MLQAPHRHGNSRAIWDHTAYHPRRDYTTVAVVFHSFSTVHSVHFFVKKFLVCSLLLSLLPFLRLNSIHIPLKNLIKIRNEYISVLESESQYEGVLWCLVVDEQRMSSSHSLAVVSVLRFLQHMDSQEGYPSVENTFH